MRWEKLVQKQEYETWITFLGFLWNRWAGKEVPSGECQVLLTSKKWRQRSLKRLQGGKGSRRTAGKMRTEGN